MRQHVRFGWATAAGAALGLILALALASPASAKKFQMSGTWLNRSGQAFLPLQFAPAGTHQSMGSWTEAPFFPNLTTMLGTSAYAQVVKDTGVVTTEMNGATLRIKEHIFKQNQIAVIPLSGTNLIQITSMFIFDAPYSTGTFKAGGGPGSFTWCQFNPACTKNSVLETVFTNAGTKGRVVYTKGANQFGGTIQIGVRSGGLVTVPINAVPFWAGHAVFGGQGTTRRKLAPGGGAADVPTTELVFLSRGLVTAPTMVPPKGSLVNYPGPFVTTMFGNTSINPGGVKFALPPVPVTSQKTMSGCFPIGCVNVGQYTTNQAFPHTTGTVLAQQRTGTGGDDLFAIMGSDARTSLGGGNINTVAGGLARRNQNGPSGPVHTAYGMFDKIFLELGTTVPSMSPAGYAAAGILMLLAVGYAFRRRIG